MPNADIKHLEEFNHEVGLLCNSRWIVSHLLVQLVVLVFSFSLDFQGNPVQDNYFSHNCIHNLHEFFFRTQIQQLVLTWLAALSVLEIVAD